MGERGGPQRHCRRFPRGYDQSNMTNLAFSSSHEREFSDPPHQSQAGARARRGWNRTVFDGLGLTFSLALCFTAAAIGAWMTSVSLATWYPGLTKPRWNPPDWVFGPVWTLLYVMMAIAAWLVGRNHRWRSAILPLGLFGGQLLLNVLWSGLFFALQNPGAVLVDVVLLWLVILATLIAFVRVKPEAGLLLVPYLAWVSFATALNFAIWRLNR